jgi:hypothetical protein
MYSDISLFHAVEQRLHDVIESEQYFVKRGYSGAVGYNSFDLAETPLNSVLIGLRNAALRGFSCVLDRFGIFSFSDTDFSFTAHDDLLAQVRFGDVVSWPTWTGTLGDRNILDRELLVEILESEVKNHHLDDYNTTAVVVYNGLVRAMTWFLAKRKIVDIAGIGKLAVDQDGHVNFEPSPEIIEMIGLRKEIDEQDNGGVSKIEFLGEELLSGPAEQRQDLEARQKIEEITQKAIADGLTAEEIEKLLADLLKDPDL